MTCPDSAHFTAHSTTSFNTHLEMHGEIIRLRPMVADDFEPLYQVAADPQIWAMHPASDRYKKDVFEGFFSSGLKSDMAFIVIDKQTDQIVGSSRYNNPDRVDKSVEIGWTFLARSCWGGNINAELKYLMISHAFDTFEKVHFCIGKMNYRSIAAVRKLGARKLDNKVDNARPDSVFYELNPQNYVGLHGYGKHN